MRDGDRIRPAGAEATRAFRTPVARPGDADSDVETLRRAAHDEGFAAGRAAAREELAAQLETLSRGMETRIGTLIEDYEQWRAELREQVLTAVKDLALTAAARLLRRVVDEGEPVAQRVLDDVLAAIGELPPLALRAHPDDLEALRQTAAPPRMPATVDWHADESIERGGLILETAHGAVDATWRAALASLDDALEGKE